MAMEVKIHKKLGEYELDVHWKSTKKRIGILGASGSGKSLTLKSIAGIEHPDQGHIQIGDHVLYDSDSRICLKPQKRNVGYMFQNYALFPTMTVEQNVGAGLAGDKKKKQEQVQKMIRHFRLEGLEKIRETNPDIVVVDINMPVKDGLSMLEDSIEEYGYDAVIVSGYSDFEYARKAIRLGVTEYLLKPVNFNELYDALRKIKDKQQAAARLRHELKQLDMEKRKLGILDEPETGDSPEGNRHVEYMMDCIRNHYSSHLSLTDISEQCGMSCTYLNSKFKSFTGYTFNDYLNRYRMQKAVDLLKENKYKVYEIADLVGFSDYKYFIKVFKKYVGCSPVKFMESGGAGPTP